MSSETARSHLSWACPRSFRVDAGVTNAVCLERPRATSQTVSYARLTARGPGGFARAKEQSRGEADRGCRSRSRSFVRAGDADQNCEKKSQMACSEPGPGMCPPLNSHHVIGNPAVQLFRAGAPGQLPRDAFPPAALSSVAAGILARCDALDGLADGMVNDEQQCQLAFDLERDAPTCSGASATGCLSAAQRAALQAVFDGVHDSSGASLYSSWPWDPGLAGAGWRFWKLDVGFAPLPFNTVIGAGALGYIFTTPPDQPELSDGGVAYQLGFDFDADAPKIFASDAVFTQSAMEFMTPPTPARLTGFREHGGKLLVVHGSADPVFSVADTVAWYGSLLAGDQHAAEYARLFLVPGMNHCTGGPATDRFDSLSALDGWVDSGDAPESIIAGVDPANPDVAAQGWPTTRTRPVCAYPKHAQLLPGASDSESASSFSCQ